MTVRDVIWHPYLNILFIECECGGRFHCRCNCSAIWCPHCGRGPELWHPVEPKPKSGRWSLPEMKIDVRRAA